jgi:membrane dipeptidase
VSKFPNLIAELLQRGWSDEDIAKLTRTNLLRVFAEVEQAAVRLQQDRPPSLMRFGEQDET